MADNVVVFTKNGCMQCRMTKRFLAEHDVSFEEHNINSNPEFVDILKKQGYQSVPIVFSDANSPVVGFRPDELKGIVE